MTLYRIRRYLSLFFVEAASQKLMYLLQITWPAIPHPSRLPVKKASVTCSRAKKSHLIQPLWSDVPNLLFFLPEGPPLLS